MKIGVVQIASLLGDIDSNIARHAQFVRLASAHHVELVVFPELSLTQYDAPYAENVAIAAEDPRLARLQAIADELGISICDSCFRHGSRY